MTIPVGSAFNDLCAFLSERGFVAIPLVVNAVGHFELGAEVNGQAARLILDTGASHTVFATSSAERLGLQMTALATRAHGVGASDYAAASTTITELRIGTVQLREVAVRTFDLAHVNRALEARGAAPVDGALGGDILRPSEAIIDYARATLYLRVMPPA